MYYFHFWYFLKKSKIDLSKIQIVVFSKVPIENSSISPTHMGHTPTLQMGLLQYRLGSDFWLTL